MTGDVDVLPDSVCPFHFEVTGDYFVYANLDPEGRLIVAQCSRTNRVEHAGADLAYARGVASRKSGAVVWGRIHLEQPVSGRRGWSQGQPIRLLLSGTAGEFETTVTDSQFELQSSPVAPTPWLPSTGSGGSSKYSTLASGSSPQPWMAGSRRCRPTPSKRKGLTCPLRSSMRSMPERIATSTAACSTRAPHGSSRCS